jgi:hypothetical protein
LAKVRSAIAVTIAPAALAAGLIAGLLALRLGGAGTEGDPLSILVTGPERLWEIADRRGPVLGVTLLVWLGAFGLALAVNRERAGRSAARLLALSLVYLPLLLLASAALEPGVAVERLRVMRGSPALAFLTLGALGGYRGLAVACGATVIAYTVDVIAGSPLTQLSLVGPNPAAGHRYYGIGNELEAILVVLVLAGTGAALSGFAPPGWCESRLRGAMAGPGRGAATFLVVATTFAFAFAYGRYGADVGAAIVLPLGGAVAAAVLAGRPRLALWALAVPLPALAILAAADLLSGSDAHLTRTVLQADGGGDVLAVLGRRLGEAGESFGRPLLLAVLPFVLAGGLIAWLRRERLAAWLRDVPAMRAGLLGALAATLVGTVANDSGALLLEIGAAYLAVFAGFAWANAGLELEPSPPQTKSYTSVSHTREISP